MSSHIEDDKKKFDTNEIDHKHDEEELNKNELVKIAKDILVVDSLKKSVHNDESNLDEQIVDHLIENIKSDNSIKSNDHLTNIVKDIFSSENENHHENKVNNQKNDELTNIVREVFKADDNNDSFELEHNKEEDSENKKKSNDQLTNIVKEIFKAEDDHFIEHPNETHEHNDNTEIEHKNGANDQLKSNDQLTNIVKEVFKAENDASLDHKKHEHIEEEHDHDEKTHEENVEHDKAKNEKTHEEHDEHEHENDKDVKTHQEKHEEQHDEHETDSNQLETSHSNLNDSVSLENEEKKYDSGDEYFDSENASIENVQLACATAVKFLNLESENEQESNEKKENELNNESNEESNKQNDQICENELTTESPVLVESNELDDFKKGIIDAVNELLDTDLEPDSDNTVVMVDRSSEYPTAIKCEIYSKKIDNEHDNESEHQAEQEEKQEEEEEKEENENLNVLKEKYSKAYNLNEEQCEMVIDFFNKNSDGITSLFDNDLLKDLMLEGIKERDIVKASQDDIDRALSVIDSNKDEKINLEQFFDLLLLFFSSKYNIKQRIQSVLENKTFVQQKDGLLKTEEAEEFVSFLYGFFGKSNDLKEDESFFNIENEHKEIESSKLADELSNKLESCAFVQWETK